MGQNNKKKGPAKVQNSKKFYVIFRLRKVDFGGTSIFVFRSEISFLDFDFNAEAFFAFFDKFRTNVGYKVMEGDSIS